jgi:hypothetical protein
VRPLGFDGRSFRLTGGVIIAVGSEARLALGNVLATPGAKNEQVLAPARRFCISLLLRGFDFFLVKQVVAPHPALGPGSFMTSAEARTRAQRYIPSSSVCPS